MNSTSEGNIRRRIAAGAAALSIALAGAAWSGCGDDDAEQAVEDAAQEAGQAAEDAADEAGQAADDAAQEAEDAADDGEQEAEDSKEEDPGY